MKKISFVIPCYNSEKTVGKVINDIIDIVNTNQNYDYEILCINDCSPDNVISTLKNIAENDKNIKVIDLAKNVGKHSAVLVGYKFSGGDFVVSIDDDGQCPIENLWELIRPLEDGHDMAMAQYKKKQEKGYKKIGSLINHFASRILLDKPKDLIFTNFIARQQYICKAMSEYQNIFPYLEGLSLHITRDVVLVPMEEHQRMYGKTNFNFKKSFALWMNGFTAFSVKPLRIASLFGGLVALLGFVFGIITIIRKLIEPNISIGYSSIIVAILFCSGIIMLLLGMIGEYLGRVYLSVNKYPQYVIKNKINL